MCSYYAYKKVTNVQDILSKMPDNIRKSCKLIELKQGQIFIQKGELVTNVDILCTGQMKVLNEFENGNVYCFATIQPIAYIGSPEVLAGARVYSSTTETQTSCSIIRMPKESFMEWINMDHKLAIEVGSFIARCLYEQSWKTGEAAVYPALYVVGAYFAKFYEGLQKECGAITCSRQQLANELGFSLRTINRNIKLLKEQGYITVKRQTILINSEQYEGLTELLNKIRQSL